MRNARGQYKHNFSTLQGDAVVPLQTTELRRQERYDVGFVSITRRRKRVRTKSAKYAASGGTLL